MMGQKNRLKKTLIAFLFTVTVVNMCFGMKKEYFGAPLPRGKTAVVFLDDVQILKINGVAKNYWNTGCEFLPGTFHLLVRYLELSPTSSSKPMEINFRAEAGHNYILTGIYETKGNFMSKGVYFTPYIEDISNPEYNRDVSKLKEKKYRKFNQKIEKSKLKQIKAHEKFIGRLASFEPMKLSFYEFDGTTIPKGIKSDTSFDLSRTRYIIAEITVKNLNPGGEDQRHTLRWRYYYPPQMTREGKQLKTFNVCDFNSDMVIKSGKAFSYAFVSWGNKEYGWIWGKKPGVKGTYAVAVFLDDIELIEAQFVIY